MDITHCYKQVYGEVLSESLGVGSSCQAGINQENAYCEISQRLSALSVLDVLLGLALPQVVVVRSSVMHHTVPQFQAFYNLELA